MKKSLILSLAFAFAVVGFSPVAFAANTASTPVSNGGVTPYTIDGQNPGGNRTCEEVGTAFHNDANHYEFSSERFDNGDQFGGVAGPITWSTTNDTYISWSGSHGGLAVIAKATNDANVYVYDGTVNSDSGLASPPAGPGPAELSNITFCWNTKDDNGNGGNGDNGDNGDDNGDNGENGGTTPTPVTPQEAVAPVDEEEAPQVEAPAAGVNAGSGNAATIATAAVTLIGSLASLAYGVVRFTKFGA